MQYPSSLDRAGLIELAIKKYFGNVDAKDLDSVVDCFHDNAMITVQTASTTHAGKENIKRMFIDFMGAYKTIIHKDFTCTVDEDNGRIVASFTAEMENEDGSWTKLTNTNFWRIRGEKFQEVYIYMSGENPLT
ncbi:MAG: ketosteroid isomerase-like protein [Halioglobus sp.]|jgi:ketosteroid isomerase-like protein